MTMTITSVMTRRTTVEPPLRPAGGAYALAVDAVRTPLTAALLEAARRGTSFATPGHRCGRSCRTARND